MWVAAGALRRAIRARRQCFMTEARRPEEDAKVNGGGVALIVTVRLSKVE